jgi:hypothetical protein
MPDSKILTLYPSIYPSIYPSMHSIDHLSTIQEKTEIEQVLPGLMQEYLAEERIVRYSLISPKLVTITAWSDVAMETLSNWPRPRPYRALHDLSHPGVGLVYSIAVEYDLKNIGIAPGKRKMVNQLLSNYPDWSLALAIVVAPSLANQVARQIAAQPNTSNQQVQTKFFFEQQAALNWLLKLDPP